MSAPTIGRSEEIAELAKALAVAQGLIEGAIKDSSNPFFRSAYADLASVWDAIRGPLSANGLSIIQMPSAEGSKVTVTTILCHSSGQWMSSELTMTAKRQLKDGGGWEELDTPQAIGSTITYARRYALQSVAGVAPEDDDGERAQGRQTPTQKRGAPPPNDSTQLLTTIRETLNDISKDFADTGHAKQFHEALGGLGYGSITDVPANRELGREVVKALKLRLADLVKK